MNPFFSSDSACCLCACEYRLRGSTLQYLLNASFEAMVSLNSLPQLAGRQSGALRQRGKLEPGHAGMGIVEPQGGGGKAAVGSRDDVLATDDLGEPHDPFGDQFGVLHQVGGVTDHARNEDLPVG